MQGEQEVVCVSDGEGGEESLEADVEWWKEYADLPMEPLSRRMISTMFDEDNTAFGGRNSYSFFSRKREAELSALYSVLFYARQEKDKGNHETTETYFVY